MAALVMMRFVQGNDLMIKVTRIHYRVQQQTFEVSK